MSKHKHKKEDDYDSDDDYKIFPNEDKDHLKEKWTPDRHYLSFPYPFFILNIGSVSSGKTNMIKNIIYRNQKRYGSKKFDRIVVFTKSKSKEWDPDDFEVIHELPDDYENFFDRDNEKNMLIIEDLVLSCKNADKNIGEKLQYYLKHETSRGLAVVMNIQDYTQIDPELRRQAQIINIFGSIACKTTLKTLARRGGITENALNELIKILKPPYDYLTIDRTKFSPYPIRYYDYKENKSFLVKITETEDIELLQMKFDVKNKVVHVG